MTTTSAAGNPFHGLTEEASATLRDCLVAEGLADEVTTVLPPFERTVRASIATVQTDLPADLPLDFALAYLTGRIAKEQVRALQHARDLVQTARAHAEHHWQAAIDAERRRVTRQSPPAETLASNRTEAV